MQALKSELRRVQQRQNECIDKYNIVISCRRYEYNALTQEAKKIRDGIEFMENIQNKMIDKSNIDNVNRGAKIKGGNYEYS